MKKVLFFICMIIACTIISKITKAKAPVIVEIQTNFKTIREATMATKTALMKQKFIPTGGVQDAGFQATRTTGSKADYYTADVMTEDRRGKIVVTITLIKSGTGMLKLQKVADEIKNELGGNATQGSIKENTENQKVAKSAQKNLSSEALQAKCKTFSAMKKGGKVLIVVGSSLLVTGFIFYVVNGVSATMYQAGGVMMPIGVLTLGGGIPLTIIGGKKSRQYCEVALIATPRSVGLACNF